MSPLRLSGTGVVCAELLFKGHIRRDSSRRSVALFPSWKVSKLNSATLTLMTTPTFMIRLSRFFPPYLYRVLP